MNDTERDELLELAHGYIERSLSPGQIADLESRLEGDAEARRVFMDFTHDHAALHWEQLPEEEDNSPDNLADFRPRRLPTLWQTFAAAAVVSLLALVLVRPPAEESANAFATMAKTESARWESGTLPTAEGARLSPGVLKLVRGLATIRFDSGAEVILEAPAELELVDEMNCVLVSGTAVAEVSEPAQGFIIKTPTANIIDHGTRFAVNVDRNTGATKTQVFDGLVEVELPGSGESVQLKTGQGNFVAGTDLGVVSNGPEEETWASMARTAPRGENWKTITTADPGAKDGYVWGGKPNDHVSDELLLLKNSSDLAGPHRKAYLQFDLQSVPQGSLETAELNLRFTPTGWGLASLLGDSHFRVYGITEDALDGWDHRTLTWDSAPANVRENGTGLDPDKTTLLGEFTIPRGIQSGTFGIRGKQLTAFLNADQNRKASLVIIRTTMETRGGGLVHAFASARHPVLPAPALVVKTK